MDELLWTLAWYVGGLFVAGGLWVGGVLFGLWWAADVAREREESLRAGLREGVYGLGMAKRAIESPADLLDDVLRAQEATPSSACGNYDERRVG